MGVGEGGPRARRWVRVAEAAELLDVSHHTLRRWADRGVVPSRRSPSGQRQFSRSVLERLAAGREARPPPRPGVCGRPGDPGRAASASAAPGSTADAAGAAEVVLELAAEALGVCACRSFEYDADRDLVSLRAVGRRGTSPGGGPPAAPRAPSPAERSLLAADRAREEYGRSACLLVPFRGTGGSRGYLSFCDETPGRRFTAAEVERAAQYATLAAAAADRERLERMQAGQDARVASLLQAGRAITSSLVPEEVLDAVAREATLVLGARYCVIWEHVPERDALVQRAGFEVDGPYTADGRAILLSEHPLERRILDGDAAVIETLSDPRLDPASRCSMEKWGEKTCLSVPLRFGDERLGILVLGETERERTFTGEELELAQGVGIQASAAVHNARLYQDLQRRSAELADRARRERLLGELGLELSSSLDVHTVLASAARRICALLGAASCDIYRCEEDGSLSCQGACLHGEVVEAWIGLRSSPLDWNASRRAIAERRPVAVPSLDDPELSAGEREQMALWGQQAVLAVPMEARGRVLGTVEISEVHGPRTFTAGEVATAEACAHLAALAVDNATLFERQADHAQRLASLLEGGRALTSSLVIRDVLDTLVYAAATSLDCPEALIFEYDAHADTLTMRSVFQEKPTVYEDLNKPYTLADYPSDRKLLEDGALVLETISDPDLPPDVRESMEMHDEKTCLSVPLSFGGKPLGVLTLIETAAERVFTEAELAFARGLGEQAAIALHNARLFENVKGLHLASLKTLSSALSAKDVYTIGHAARVAAYAVMLAHELGWGRREVEQLEEATYLHDVGKIAIADRVLLKSGALTEEEWAQMRQHPVVSAEIIEAILAEDFVAGVRHHHERYDGKGYPDGLAGERIPEAARLLCIVDSYDAMSSRRIYRPALSSDECVRELNACSGSQFDPAMVAAFLRVLDRLEEHRKVLEAVAQEAASRIDARDHARLRYADDRDRPEYERVRAALREARAAHPFVDTVVTEVRVDDQRCMIVVDAEDDEEKAIALGEVVFYGDPETEVFAGRPSLARVISVDPWGTWQLAAAPIVDEDGAVAGLVCAGRVPAAEFAAGGYRSSASDTFAEIIRSAAARQTRAEIESVTDALTGLANRRHFEDRLHEWVETASLEGRDLSLLFCDLDRFKQLNDRHGHPAGDEVLQAVGRVLATSVRNGDIAARYGGDEFAVLLLDADEGEASEVAKRIHGHVAAVRAGRGGRRISISVGCATLAADGDDAEGLLARADRAMYAAKERGRDLVVQASELPAAGTLSGAGPAVDPGLRPVE